MKFKYLAAWDDMIGTNPWLAETHQRLAETDGAPEDAVYFKLDETGKRVWKAFSEINRADTCQIIRDRVDELSRLGS